MSGVLNLQRCLAVSGPRESHLRKAYALLISSLMKARQAGLPTPVYGLGEVHHRA